MGRGGILAWMTVARLVHATTLFALDLRTAEQALGGNDIFEIANGLLDVFAPGEAVQPAVADMAASPARRATPVLPPTPEPSAAPTAAPAAPAAATAPVEPTPAAAQATAEAAGTLATVETTGSSWMIPLVAVTAPLGGIVAIGLILGKRRRP